MGSSTGFMGRGETKRQQPGSLVFISDEGEELSAEPSRRNHQLGRLGGLSLPGTDRRSLSC